MINIWAVIIWAVRISGHIKVSVIINSYSFGNVIIYRIICYPPLIKRWDISNTYRELLVYHLSK